MSLDCIHAAIGSVYRPQRETVAIRLDADVLAWLKASGVGFRIRINNFLRLLMQRNQARYFAEGDPTPILLIPALREVAAVLIYRIQNGPIAQLVRAADS